MIPPQSRNTHLIEYLLIVLLTILFVTLPISALVGFIIFVPVYLLSCVLPNYGKFVSYTDSWTDEDFVTNVPRNSIVITVTLKGHISLLELRSLFQKQVLGARSSVNSNKIRYPELTQYLSNFICFRIWKSDPYFCIENHIVEQQSFTGNQGDIHGELLNKPFEKNRSPWEIVLFRNVLLTDGSTDFQNNGPISIVALRSHHVLGDAKSLLKLLVECLGNKTLKTANAQEATKTGIQFVMMFPFKYFIEFIKVSKSICQSYGHPFRVKDYSENSAKLVVSFSDNIRMADIKYVAKLNGVKTSAVVMSIIAGAMRKHCGVNWEREVAIGYPLTKPGHPETLGNHVYWGILQLPTNQSCAKKRLFECNQEFERVNVGNLGKYMNCMTMLTGFLVYPMSKLRVNLITPTGISNNAGEEEGFSVGTYECTDYRMSAGPMRGVAGLFFSTISYKGEMRIAVIAKQSVVSKEIADVMTKEITLELQLLM